MSNKPKMYYRVRTTKNPFTKEAMYIPHVVDRKTLSLSQIVEYAQTVGYMRGQQEDLEGLANGLIEAMRDRAKAGYTIDVKDWFLIKGFLKGKLDETQRLGANNSYCVRIKPKKDLNVSINDFTWVCVDSEAPMRITGIYGTGGKSGMINPNGAIVANGFHLASVPGDSLTLSWKEGDTEKMVVCTPPKDVSEMTIAFNWPSNTAIPEGTEVKLTYRLHRTPQSVATVITKLVIAGAPDAKGSS